MPTCKIKKDADVIPMSEMEPCQIAQIVEPGAQNNGEIVLRSAGVDSFEVMSLTNFRKDSCWLSSDCPISVRLLTEPLTIILSND